MSNGNDDDNVQGQIDEMLNINLDNPMTDTPTTDAPSGDVETDPPQTDAPTTDAPADEHETDPPSTDEPETKAPETDAPTTDAPKVDYMEEIERLREKVEELSGKKKPPVTSPPATQPPLEEVDFIGDDDPEELTRDKGALNKLLNKVFSKGVDTGVRRSEEGVLRKIPDLVKKTTALAASLEKATEEFYDKNKDLEKFKKVCGTVFEELVSEHSDWTYQKALEETGKEVRKRLELEPPKPPSKNDKKEGSPRFPRRPKGSRNRQRVGGKTETDSMLSEIDKMNEV